MFSKICLCDDDLEDRQLFEEALINIHKDLALSIFTDGEDLVLQLFDSHIGIPDIIFLDINMQRKNGIDTLAEIKSHTHLYNIPVVILTTSSNPATIAAAYSLGACRYCIKPPSFKLLREQIKKIISLPLKCSASENDFVINFV